MVASRSFPLPPEPPENHGTIGASRESSAALRFGLELHGAGAWKSGRGVEGVFVGRLAIGPSLRVQQIDLAGAATPVAGASTSGEVELASFEEQPPSAVAPMASTANAVTFIARMVMGSSIGGSLARASTRAQVANLRGHG